MTVVPTVTRWWGRRTDLERLDLYTRSSFYGAMAFTALLATFGLGHR